MDISEIVIGAGQLGSSVFLGGMALMYSHRVYNIEKSRDVQSEKDKLLALILELSKDNQEYFMKLSNLKHGVVGSNGESIYSNVIWNTLQSEKFDFQSKYFKKRLEDKFNKINKQKYESIRISRSEIIDEFLESHQLYIKSLLLFYDRITLSNYNEDIKSSLLTLLKSISIEYNNFIKYYSPEQIFYYYHIAYNIANSTDLLIQELSTLLQEKK